MYRIVNWHYAELSLISSSIPQPLFIKKYYFFKNLLFFLAYLIFYISVFYSVIRISFRKKKVIAIVDLVKSFLDDNEISLSEEIVSYLKVKPGEHVKVNLALEPKSTVYISKKLNGLKLSKKEISLIVHDIDR